MTTTDRNGHTITTGARVTVTIARYGECSGSVRRAGTVDSIEPWPGQPDHRWLTVTLDRPVNGFSKTISNVNPQCVVVR